MENESSGTFLSVNGNLISVNHPGCFAEIAVFDVTGRRLETLQSGSLDRGEYTYQWNHHTIPNGLFFVNYRWESASATARLLRL